MSDWNAIELRCPECYSAVPDDAVYCPSCGRAVLASHKRSDAEDGDRTAWGGLIPVEELLQEKRFGAAVLSAFAVGGFAVWLAFGGPTADEIGADDVATGNAAAAGQSDVHGALHRARTSAEVTADTVDAFSYRLGTDDRTGHQTAVVRHDGRRVLRLYTPNQTDFETLDARTHTVQRRIERGARRHVAARADSNAAGVRATRGADGWRVVWNDGEDSQLLVRVTSEDVRHWNQRPDAEVTERELARRIAREVDGLYRRIARGGSGV